MTTSVRHETAKIYAFPQRGRMIDGRRDAEKAPEDLRLQRGPTIDCGSWYHQAAVQEADRTRKP
ncbi:DUF2735 domain-containing protein [Methylobacterium sp. BTF04]|uniref:DUF2735 domain-containing protein n=1 Tax=Methylobacterium sp. BTF04 TaxID=2708300 RepID=UPI0013D630BB|nr:DUF2735 domain-containing protein [Methylobacterium sp. BTF04]NEU12901.1 DUF2735 domain-containing protein [Methylobacterium sp. BTF04]